uniref:NADH dehydrogenase subunit 4 n=1 Tax=Xyloplax princealberti TaxID=3083365 RepID=UPI002E75BC60|nr:NADH dehydrogenase subunit 4 [Xyloplax princealberti]WQM48555.1 NADH dehydrogenase subunit 4 [Xyloplax princealberti]
MTHLIFISFISIISPWFLNQKNLWIASIINAIIITLISFNTINLHFFSTWHNISFIFAIDNLSSPLIILSIWLVPLSLLASINTIYKTSFKTQQTFISLIFFILFTLILTFSTLELSLFFIAFESTLLPTLILISRWGAQKERFQAGIYFLFYTISGSLPLLISIILYYNISSTLIFPSSFLINFINNFSYISLNFWWIFFIIAFLIKMPIYGFHLWLPKAHVEAPIAGSIILAAILLKLGGYALIRTISIFIIPSSYYISSPLIIFCIWGSLITSIICLRQTDLKALIAYSSIGHMSLIAASIFSLSLWGFNGALSLMIAHGFISSGLFCLANLFYERNNTRTLIITRGFSMVSPLLTLWWIIICVSNLGLPPTPNLIGELLIIVSLINWNLLVFPLLTVSTIFSAIYSLLIFQNTNNNIFPTFIRNINNIQISEHILIFFHIFPLIFLIVNPSIILIF